MVGSILVFVSTLTRTILATPLRPRRPSQSMSAGGLSCASQARFAQCSLRTTNRSVAWVNTTRARSALVRQDQ
jgi:hypothetical protein